TNSLSALSRWKIADNLLRSLAPMALLLLFLIGWYLLPNPGLWTLALLGIILVPPLLSTTVDALRKPREIFLRQHFTAVIAAAGRQLGQAIFRLSCLPHEDTFNLTAILRSLWRLWFAPRLLLE